MAPVLWRYSVWKWCLVVYHILSVRLILNGTRVFFSSTGLNWRHSSDFVLPRVLALYPSLIELFFFVKYPFWFLLSYSNCVSLSLSFHQNLRKMEAESSEEPGRDLNELQNDDWVGNWTSDLWPPASTDLKSSSLKTKRGNHTPLWFYIKDSPWLHVLVKKSLRMHVTL